MDIYYNIINTLTYFPLIMTFVGGVYGLSIYKKLNRSFKIITLLIALSFINDAISRIYTIYVHSNLFFLSTYTLIELVLIYLFLDNSKFKYNIFFRIIFLIILIFNLYEVISIDYFNFANFQIYSRTINSLFLFMMTGVIIIQKINEDKLHNTNKIYFALPFYLAISALLSLPINFLINYNDVSVFLVWGAYIVNLSVFFSVLSYQLWKYGKTQKI